MLNTICSVSLNKRVYDTIVRPLLSQCLESLYNSYKLTRENILNVADTTSLDITQRQTHAPMRLIERMA